MTNASEQITLPYGDSQVALRLPPGKTVDVYEPSDLPAADDGVAEVRRAMSEPLGTPPLVELARGRRRVAIVVDDAMRPVPIGTTRRGVELSINRTVVEADLRILTGDVELHQFAGYGGGAKSVMPGVADARIIEQTHARMEMPGTGPGRFAGNPVRAEVEESADLLGIDYIVNVVLNSRHEIVRAFAGDVHAAFLAGTELVDRMYKVAVPKRYDVVLTSPGGHPRDIDLYQAQKAIASARRMTVEGGKIVALAECREGYGGKTAYEWAQAASKPQDIVDRLRAKFVMGGHKAYQLARDVLWADVYFYSAMSTEIVETFFLKAVNDLGVIDGMLADARSIACLPQATLMLPVLAGEEQTDF